MMMMNSSNDSVNIVHWNCQSAWHKKDFILTFLSNCNDDIICLNETHFDSGKSRYITHSDFLCIDKPISSRRGGISMFIRKPLPFRRRPECELSNNVIVLEINKNNSVLIVIAVYIHPLSKDSDTNAIFDSIDTVLDLQLPVVIIGDCNARHKRWSGGNSNTLGRKVKSFCSSNELFVVNRLSSTTKRVLTHLEGGCLDIAITNDRSIVSSFTICNPLSDHPASALLSDHVPILCSVSINRLLQLQQRQNALQHLVQLQRQYVWNVRSFDQQLYRDCLTLSLANFSNSFDNMHVQFSNDPARAVVAAADLVSSAICAAANRSCSKHLSKHQRKHWWQLDPNLDRLHAEVQRFQRKFFKSRSAAHKQQWHSARKAFRKACDAARMLSWNELASAIQSNNSDASQVAWSNWHRTLPSEQIAPHVICDANDNLPSSESHGLNNLCDYYARISVAPSITSNNDAKIVDFVADKYEQLRQSQNTSVLPSAITTYFSLESIANLCESINTSKAIGSDDIHPLFLLHAPPALIEALYLIFNYSFHYGVMPECWKRANVISLYKGSGERSAASAHRPISLLPHLSKLLEKLIKPLLETAIEHNISPLQSGFRKRRDTTEQIYRVTHAIKSAFAKNSFLDVVFLDITKAFDTCWHDMLLFKCCSQFAIDDRLWLWLHDFLQNRQFRCVFGGFFSDWHAIGAGVPQGAVLSPLLYNIFINDIIPVIVHLNGGKFADDISLFADTPGPSGLNVIQDALQPVSDWADVNKVNFNLTKCGHVRFSRQRKCTSAPSLTLQLGIIPFLSSYRYLGIILDSKLDFKLHFAFILKKVRFNARNIMKIFWGSSSSSPPGPLIAVALTKVVNLPCVTYGFAVWYDQVKHKQRTEQIVSALLAPIRRSLSLPISTHKHSLLVEFDILPFDLLQAQHCFILGKRLLNSSDSNPAKHLFLSDLASARRYFQQQQQRQQQQQSSGRILARAHWNLGHQICNFQHRFDIDFAQFSNAGFSSKLLRCKLVALSLQRLQQGSCGHLRHVRSHPQVPSFYRYSGKLAAVLRSHLRLGRTLIGAHQFSHGASVSSNCAVCNCNEDNNHFLFICPVFANVRASAIVNLSNINCVQFFNSAYVLGEVLPPNNVCDAFRDIVDSFLVELHQQRRLF